MFEKNSFKQLVFHSLPRMRLMCMYMKVVRNSQNILGKELSINVATSETHASHALHYCENNVEIFSRNYL